MFVSDLSLPKCPLHCSARLTLEHVNELRAAVEAVDAVVGACASLDTNDGGGGGNEKGGDASHCWKGRGLLKGSIWIFE